MLKQNQKLAFETLETKISVNTPFTNHVETLRSSLIGGGVECAVIVYRVSDDEKEEGLQE